MAQRLALGQPDRERGVALAAMDRVDAGPVDLGDVGAIGQRERDAAEDHRLRREPSERRLPVLGGDGEGGHAEPDQVDEEDRRDAPEDVGVDRRQEAEREHRRWLREADQGHGQAQNEHADLDDHEHPDVEPEGVEHVRERVLEDLGVEERVPDQRPAGAGDDERRDPAEHDHRRDDGDRHPSPVARLLGRRALGSAVAHGAPSGACRATRGRVRRSSRRSTSARSRPARRSPRAR